ncbi:MAG: SdpI family protein [Acidobacteria bacterium]|nr:SdpI family protein [Acidobacteriota bacterium]
MQLHYIISLVMVVLSIPLILQKVPRNPIYGFRTPKTLSNDTIWYPANKTAGWDLLLAGVAILILTSMLGKLNVAVVLGATGLAVAHSFWALRKL